MPKQASIGLFATVGLNSEENMAMFVWPSVHLVFTVGIGPLSRTSQRQKNTISSIVMRVEIIAKLARAASEFRVDVGQALRCRVGPVKFDFLSCRFDEYKSYQIFCNGGVGIGSDRGRVGSRSARIGVGSDRGRLGSGSGRIGGRVGWGSGRVGSDRSRVR